MPSKQVNSCTSCWCYMQPLEGNSLLVRPALRNLLREKARFKAKITANKGSLLRIDELLELTIVCHYIFHIYFTDYNQVSYDFQLNKSIQGGIAIIAPTNKNK